MPPKVPILSLVGLVFSLLSLVPVSLGAVTCVESQHIPKHHRSWLLSRDKPNSTPTRHYFVLDHNQQKYKDTLVKAPENIEYLARIWTALPSVPNGYNVALFNNEIPGHDAQKDGQFIYTLYWGDKKNPTYMKHWYLSGFDVCTATVSDDVNGFDGNPTAILTQYWE